MITDATMSRVPAPISGSIMPVARLSQAPRMPAAISTPGMLSRPPRMAMASAFIRSNDRLQSTPCMLPQRIPAAVAAIAASPPADQIGAVDQHVAQENRRLRNAEAQPFHGRAQ